MPQAHPSCDPAVLDLGLAAALEVLNAAVGGEPSGIPKSDGILPELGLRELGRSRA